MIFFVIALTSFMNEMILWPSYFRKRSDFWLPRWARKFLDHRRRPSVTATGHRILGHMNSNRWCASPLKDHLRAALFKWDRMTNRDRVGLLILTPMDATNSIWLVYIVLAQTFGAYKSCSCMSSNWGWHEGYIDFESFDFYRSNGVYSYWVPGTVLSCFAMVSALAFLTVEWCTLSHLSTSDYDAAMAGLHRTRVFKRYTIWVREVPNWVIDTVVTGWHAVLMHTRKKVGRRSLVWSVGPAKGSRDCERGNHSARRRRQGEEEEEDNVRSLQVEVIDGLPPLGRDPSPETYVLSSNMDMVRHQKDEIEEESTKTLT